MSILEGFHYRAVYNRWCILKMVYYKVFLLYRVFIIGIFIRRGVHYRGVYYRCILGGFFYKGCLLWGCLFKDMSIIQGACYRVCLLSGCLF